MNGGRVLGSAVRVLADWRVLLAALVSSVLLFLAQTLARAAASAAGIIPRVPPWSLAPAGSSSATLLTYSAVFLVATIPVAAFTVGLVMHAVARSLAEHDVSLSAVWTAAVRTWPAFLVPVAASTVVSQLVANQGRGLATTAVALSLTLVADAVTLWAVLTEAAIAVTGKGFAASSSSSFRLLRTRFFSVIGAELLLAIPAALVAFAVLAMVALPGFGDVMKSSSGLAQALFTLAVMPVLNAYTSGGFVELYVQLSAPWGTQEEA